MLMPLFRLKFHQTIFVFFLLLFLLQKNSAFVSFVVLTISVSHFCVSGQYLQSQTQSIDTVTEYEYYDDFADASTTVTVTSIPYTTSAKPTTTTTTTTTTSKPTTSNRYLTTRRTTFRPLVFSNNGISSRKKFGTNKLYIADSYTEASNENALVQSDGNIIKKQPTPPQLRNAVVDVDRSTSGKDYAQEKFATSVETNNGNGNYFSRRYARFLFKSRSG